ncbi:transporter [Lignipirellula cremea]|uniref:Transporter n=1 Tax=Lignipirellula cremea TaxID=2528010 RepID=A0A518E0U6_9BACT|nr:transporter [Lignipirellula cremea]QDU97709.1 hypothetical protein Pla8534_55620 [Lignipirellula cremea]
MHRPWILFVAVGLFASSASLVGAQEFSLRPSLELPTVEEFFAGEEAGEEAEEEPDEIETDRDSFTPAVTTAGAGRIIVEAAHSFVDNRSVAETHSFPELLVRVGANDWLEFRVGWNYEVGGAGSPVSGNVPSDFDDEGRIEREHRLLYGLKATVSQQEGWRPASSFIIQGFTPTGGEATNTELSATYVFGWTLPNNWVWDTSIRYGTGSQEDDHFNVWAPSTVLKIPVGEHWKLHAEYFGVMSDNRADETVQNFFSPGAHYLITPNLEIGVRVGWGLNREAASFFSNAGLGYRY